MNLKYTAVRYQRLITEIDRINNQDPSYETVDNIQIPAALAYSKRMLSQLLSLQPDAPETLRIAAYGQHINRWKIPRSHYPEGRQGYLQWREALLAHHSGLLARLMVETGYTTEETDQVCRILSKRALKQDFHTQRLEDVACLVFLEYYLAPMQKKHDREKFIRILRKTWRKMSPLAKQAAQALNYTRDQRQLLQSALNRSQ